MPQAISTNTFGTAKWIVDSSASQGTHTTIQGAINSASSGDTIFVRPGTYTENLALKAGVNITAYNVNAISAAASPVKVIGKMTYSSAGSVALGGIFFQTNADFLLVVSGANASIVLFDNCLLNCTNNTGISHTSSNAASAISIVDCTGDIGAVGITLFVSTSAGFINFTGCSFGNSGASVTQSSSSAGVIQAQNSLFSNAFLSTGTSNLNFTECNISFGAGIPFTLNGTTGHAIRHIQVFTGAFSSISVGAGAQLNVTVCSLGSAGAANIISGAGTVFYDDINTQGNSGTITGGAVTGGRQYVGSVSFDGGTNNLSTFTDWTAFTPTVLGGTVAGVTVYGTRLGQWMRIGNQVTVQISILTVSATGTGNLSIGNLPFTVSNTIVINPQGAAVLNVIAWPAGTTNIAVEGVLGTTTAFISASGTAAAAAAVQLANAAFSLRATLIYRV